MLANPESAPFKAVRPLGITQAQPARSLKDEKINQLRQRFEELSLDWGI
jgi:hypothetical protein